MLHEALLADTERLRPPVGAAHRFGTDRSEGGAVRPAMAQTAKVELEERGVIGGQRCSPGAAGRRACRHGRSRVADRRAPLSGS